MNAKYISVQVLKIDEFDENVVAKWLANWSQQALKPDD